MLQNNGFDHDIQQKAEWAFSAIELAETAEKKKWVIANVLQAERGRISRSASPLSVRAGRWMFNDDKAWVKVKLSELRTLLSALNGDEDA